MGVAKLPLRSPAHLTCAMVVGCLLGARCAVAFPASDPSNPSIEADVPPPTDSDLRHQLQLQSGFGAGAAGAGGWTFVPRISAQEMYTDNVLETATNRRWDLVTLVTPGISILGDVPNAQVKLNYGPEIREDLRTPQEDGITQQLLGTGLFTIIPDEIFVDARAVAGGTPTAPGFGATGLGISPVATSGGISGPGASGLSKQNTTQTNSFSISPYILHRFGDTGTAKIGYEFNQSSYSSGGGNSIPLFFQSGSGGQQNTTNQGVAQFETGERFAPFRDLVVANVTEGNGTGVNRDSSQDTLINRLGYDVNREVNIYGELGYENLRFGGIPPTRIDDVVWGGGTTLTPNPDSQITIGYGHKDGTNSLQFSGYYALTSRTRISARYSTGLQSDLQAIQSELDLADLDTNGNAVDSQTGAPLFIGNNALGAQAGLFRTKSLTVTASTVLDRDQINVSLQGTEQTTVAVAPTPVVVNPLSIPTAPVGQNTTAATVIVTWQHQFSEALSMSDTLSYSTTDVATSGTFKSIAASLSLQYLISETLAATARYSYFDRMSPVASQNIYQNLFIVGISKQF
jgi:uncharacterized protein (PEP-CTERM system associated)